MVLRSLSKINKSGISYLLIILAFALLALSVFIFFEFRIKVIESKKMKQDIVIIKQLKKLIPKSNCHDHTITHGKSYEKI
jgi:hypothetical protein